jgi:signal transduction histidine kinase
MTESLKRSDFSLFFKNDAEARIFLGRIESKMNKYSIVLLNSLLLITLAGFFVLRAANMKGFLLILSSMRLVVTANQIMKSSVKSSIVVLTFSVVIGPILTILSERFVFLSISWSILGPALFTLFERIEISLLHILIEVLKLKSFYPERLKIILSALSE